MARDLIPRSEDNRKSWAENMILKFPPLYVALGFTKLESDALIDDLTMMIFLIADAQSATAEAKARNANKKQMLGEPTGEEVLSLPSSVAPVAPENMVEPGILGRIRKMLGRIKLAKGFSNAIGEQLQIISTETDARDTENAKPTFEAVALVIGVLLKWKKGAFDGVIIECQRGAETTYTLLDKDFKSPFTDMRPNLVAGQPEKRRYRMIYLLDDEIVGQYSSETVITTNAA